MKARTVQGSSEGSLLLRTQTIESVEEATVSNPSPTNSDDSGFLSTNDRMLGVVVVDGKATRTGTTTASASVASKRAMFEMLNTTTNVVVKRPIANIKQCSLAEYSDRSGV